MKTATLAAGRWTTASALSRSGLQLLQIVILARLLAPQEFGLVAITTAWLAILSLITDFGFSRALIHFQDTSAKVRSSLFWFNLGLSLVLTLLVVSISPIVATLYQAPELSFILITASLSLPIAAVGQQFRALAEKNLQFAPLACNEIVAAAIGFIVALVMAWHGSGAFALVGGLLATTTASSLLAWAKLSEGLRPGWNFRLDDIRPHLKFGSYLVGDSLANTVQLQADIFIGGIIAGPAALGMYNLPRDLSLRLANTVVNPVITRISFPLMSRAQNDRKALQEIYLAALRLTSSINFPIYLALALFADEVVAILYGPAWHEAGGYLRLLAIWGALRSTGNPSGSLIYAVGRARLAFWWNLALLLVIPSILWLSGLYGGLTGMTWGMLGVQVFMLPAIWKFLIHPCCGVGFPRYLYSLLPAACCALAGGVVALLMAQWSSTPLLRLAIGLSSGAATYWLLSLKFNRLWIDALSSLLDMRPTGHKPQ